MFKLNFGYKILSPTGFVNFTGIQKIYKPFYHHIIFDDNTEIKCSSNHSFGKLKITSEKLKVGDSLNGKTIVYNEIVEEGIWLYDPIDVENGNLYYSNNIISHNCEFLGSVDTLISPSKLRTIVIEDPIISNAGLDIYEKPKENHEYIITVDVSRGVCNDYSAFIIYDITTVPYKIIGKYRNNEIKPMLFPNIIETTAQNYNKAFVLIEVNDIGAQVADIMQFDLEYQNLLMCAMRGRAGQILGTGFSHKSYLGVKTTTNVKKTGCSNLKTLIEDDKLLLCDYEILSELTTFIQKNKSFESEDGCNDDLVMCMVIFAWMVIQPYFKEMTSNDVRQRIYEEQKNAIEQDMSPFGFLSDGLIDEEKSFVDDNGDTWHLDEFGDKSFIWEYSQSL